MYVIYVQSGREVEIVGVLRHKGYTVYAPRRVVRRRKGGVSYRVPEVLFDGYVFIDLTTISADDYYKIKDIPGIGNFVSRTCGISDAEEEYIRALCNNGADIEISRGYISDNGTLKITSGFLVPLQHKIIKYSKRQHRAMIEIMVHGKPHKVVCGVDIE